MHKKTLTPCLLINRALSLKSQKTLRGVTVFKRSELFHLAARESKIGILALNERKEEKENEHSSSNYYGGVARRLCRTQLEACRSPADLGGKLLERNVLWHSSCAHRGDSGTLLSFISHRAFSKWRYAPPANLHLYLYTPLPSTLQYLPYSTPTVCMFTQ